MIAILVPVLGRAAQIEPLLASIAGTTVVEYHVVLICSPGDEALSACLDSDADTIVANWAPDRADYAKKLGLGYRHTNEQWIFQGATDLRFHNGWDEQALLCARRHKAGVVGTNDMGNPLVKRGQHSTHSLIARSYIEEYGGTADNSGVIFSEAYDHQWTDNEFVETAKRRRQFVFCRNSIVEHMHPHWGKAEHDATYDKALRDTKSDIRIFQHRRKKFARGGRYR